MSTLKDWTAAHREWVDGLVLTLRDAGVPGERIGEELAAVHAHCRDADTFPGQELGTGAEYARTLLADGAHALGGKGSPHDAEGAPLATPGLGGTAAGPAREASPDTAPARRDPGDPRTRGMVEGFLPVAAQVMLLFVTAYAVRGWILRVDLQLNAGTLVCWGLFGVLLLVLAGLCLRGLRRLVRPVPLLGLYVTAVILGIVASLLAGADLPILLEADPRPVAVVGLVLILLIAVVATVLSLRRSPGGRHDAVARPTSARLVSVLVFWLIPAYLLVDAGITAMTAP